MSSSILSKMNALRDAMSRQPGVPKSLFRNPALYSTGFLSDGAHYFLSRTDKGKSMAVSTSKAVDGDVHVDNIFTSCNDAPDLTKPTGVYFKRLQASVNPGRPKPLSGLLSFGYSTFDPTRRCGLHGPWLNNFSASSSACYSAGAAPDVSLDGNAREEELADFSISHGSARDEEFADSSISRGITLELAADSSISHGSSEEELADSSISGGTTREEELADSSISGGTTREEELADSSISGGTTREEELADSSISRGSTLEELADSSISRGSTLEELADSSISQGSTLEEELADSSISHGSTLEEELVDSSTSQGSTLEEELANSPTSHGSTLEEEFADSSISHGSTREEDLADPSISIKQSQFSGQTIRLFSGSCFLPHPDKEETGGEDAHFICTDKHAIGVADGISAWARVGVNAGLFASELMANSEKAIQEEPEGSINLMRVLEKAHSNTKAMGSSTACIIALTEKGLHAINLGDSRFIVIGGNGRTIFSSPVQQHGFNATYQLHCGNGGDPPSSAEVFTIPVTLGDVVIAGTDGLFDNLYKNEVIPIVVGAIRTRLDPQVTAQRIAALARQRALDPKRKTPYSTAAQEAGHLHSGGKLDDITVVVSYITSSSVDEFFSYLR